MTKCTLKCILFFLTFLCIGFKSIAQNHVIKGNITDTINQMPLRNASVSVLTAADSFLYKFTKTDQSGNFSVQVPDSGRYFLLMEYPHYASYTSATQAFGKDISLGKIVMLTKANILQEVIVQQKVSAIKIKGDTTEFAADSFKIQPNATVEELLKRLPGIQVDKDGKITAQGKQVQRVLVDGEDFFGDDPKLVTKNLRADVVDKVQVFDKKSDQAAFTGISDGNDERTINLKIKETAKHGTFGKLQAGAGTNGFHQSEGSFNQFNKSQKFSVVGAVGNTAKVGLDWDNKSRNWNNEDNSSNDAADIQTAQGSNSSLISWDGNYGDNGVPLSQFGGLHYDNTFKYGTKILGDYKINNLSIKGNSQTDIQNNLSTGSLTTRSTNFFDNQSFRNKLDGRGEIYLDSSKQNSLVVNAHGQLDHRNSASNTESATYNSDGNYVNNSSRKLTSKGDINTVSTNMLFRHKFKKERRTLSVYLSEQYNTDNNNGLLDNTINYYNTTSGAIDSTSLTNQWKNNTANNLILNAKATYSEPLSKNASLIINYGIIMSNSKADNLSYNQGANGAYTALDSTYSNSYKFNQMMHRAGLFYYYNTKKINFNIGSNVGFNQYQQTNNYTKEEDKRNFVNWYPQTFLRYNLAGNKRISFRYNGSNTQPSMTQIQPLAQNTDPLNVYLGNQELKPSYVSTASLDLESFDIVTMSGIFASVSGTQSQNAITTNTTTDISTGKTSYQYINANGNYTLSAFAGSFNKIQKWDAQVGLFLTYSQSRNINFVNSVKNESNSNQMALNFRLGKDKEQKYFLSLNGNVGYNLNKTSLQSQQNNNYLSFNVNPSATVYLQKTLKFNVDYNFNYYGKSNSFSDPYSIGIFNAYLSKTFFKNEGLEIRASVNDLFNKNLNLQRTNYGNQIYQVLNSTIKRYALISVIWNFKTGMATGSSNNDRGPDSF